MGLFLTNALPYSYLLFKFYSDSTEGIQQHVLQPYEYLT